MASKGQEFNVDTRPTKQIVVNGLTKDATVEACLFDLIDNSIDAARNTLLGRAADTILGTPKEGTTDTDLTLPESYEGFKINITLSGERCVLSDNCGGIPSQALSKMVLRFGQKSSHELGIGTFGVGLNRALFKLGKVTKLSTDTGEERSELVFDTQTYLISPDWELPAIAFPSDGEIGTTIEISQLPEDISVRFADADQVADLVDEIGRRYGNFIDKGLALSVNKKLIPSNTIKIRQDGPFKGDYLFFKTDDGVAVHIEFGQHKDHRFTIEEDYNKDINNHLTQEYGWSILCNDRAVVLSDRTRKTGWDSKFHTEFYGFVGIARFISVDASKLPWITTKTDVDLNNKSYQKTLEKMQEFAAKWRKISGEVKRIRNKGGTVSSQADDKNKPKDKTKPKDKNKTKGKNKGKKTSPTPTIRVALNQLHEILPPDVDEQHCSDKQRALVHEAKTLDLKEQTYSGLALIRILFETSVVNYYIRHENFESLKQFAIEQREANGAKLKASFKKKMVPKLDEMLKYMANHPETWAPKDSVYRIQSLNLLAGHKTILNGVIHDPFMTVGYLRAVQIRDEAMPVLRHLIES